MITLENETPLDDSQASEADDQQSQRDINSRGLEERSIPRNDEQADTERLKQAYKAAEPSYTLDPDKNIDPNSYKTEDIEPSS